MHTLYIHPAEDAAPMFRGGRRVDTGASVHMGAGVGARVGATVGMEPNGGSPCPTLPAQAPDIPR